MAKQLNVNLAFTADTGKAKAQLQDLNKQLDNLISGKNVKNIDLGITEEINEGIAAAAKLKAQLNDATDVNTGKLDLTKFSQSLKKSGMELKDYAETLKKLGPQGSEAFISLARSISTAEVPLIKVNKKLEEMWTTLKNTARWQISSSILHGFMGSVQSAFGYAEDLNESLNNIRIVTGQNIDQMAQFAKEANKAAKALSATTTDYTNASLIYYQQGLSDQEVQERADITIKMANVSRESAEIVSDQMTAVWNNFDDGSKSLEYYADVMTALGAATASSTAEISDSLEKFAAVAETVGLSYEYATASLATITATTRQSADVVGNALKTLFARIQGLNLGETLDDGTTLNKYSQALEKVGISIFEQNGNMKEMDVILNEMGAKWNTLSKDQQTALAQTVAGVRQYTQLIALMDNWDYFQENLGVASNAEGALQEQADIYAESWEAAEKRVRAAAEAIYSNLIDDEFFIDLLDFGADALNMIDKIMDSLGGLPGILSVISAILLKTFKGKIADEIGNITTGIENVYSLTTTTKKDTWNQGEDKKRYKAKSLGKNEETGKERVKVQEIIKTEEKKPSENKWNDLKAEGLKQAADLYQSDGTREGEMKANHFAQEMQLQEQFLQKAHLLTEQEKEQFQYQFDGLRIMQQKAEEQTKLVEKQKEILAIEERRLNLSTGKDTVKKYKKSITTMKDLDDIFAKVDGDLDDDASYTEGIRREFENKLREHYKTVTKDATGKEIVKYNKLPEVDANSYADWIKEQWALIEEESNKTLEEAGPKFKQRLENFGKVYLNNLDMQDQAKNMANSANQYAEKMGENIENISKKLATWKENAITAAGGLAQLTAGFTMAKTALESFDEAGKDGAYTLQELGGAAASLGAGLTSAFNGLKELNTITVDNTGKTLGAALANTKLGGVFAKLGGGAGTAAGQLLALGGTVALVAAAIGVLAFAINEGVKAYNADATAAKEAAEAADNLRESSSKLRDEAEELQSTFENYDSLLVNLKSAKENTDEWREALEKVNDETLNILEKYPDLLKMENVFDEAGRLNKDTIDKYIKTAENKADDARLASISASASASEKKVTSDTTNLSREIDDFVDGYLATTATYARDGGIVTTAQAEKDLINNLVKSFNEQRESGVITEGADEFNSIINDYTKSLGLNESEQTKLAEKLQSYRGDIVELANATKNATVQMENVAKLSAQQILGQSATEDQTDAWSQAYIGAKEDYTGGQGINRFTRKNSQVLLDLLKDAGITTGLSNNAVYDDNGVLKVRFEDGTEQTLYEIKELAATNYAREQANQEVVYNAPIFDQFKEKGVELNENISADLATSLMNQVEFNDALIQAFQDVGNSAVEQEKLIKDILNSQTKEDKEAAEIATLKSDAKANYDLDPELIEEQSKQLMSLYKVEGLTEKETVKLAIENQRMNKGVEDLIDNWEDWNKELKAGQLDKNKKGTAQYAKTINDLTKTIADLTGASANLELPDEFFDSEDNLKLIEQAANGSEQAINELGVAVGRAQVELMAFEGEFAQWYDNNNLLHTMSTATFETYKSEVLKGIDELAAKVADGSVKVGDSVNFMGEDWVKSLNEMAKATGMSVEEMNSMLSSMGLEADVTISEQKVVSRKPVTRTVVTPIDTDENSETYEYETHSYIDRYEDIPETVQVAQIATNGKKAGQPAVKYIGNGSVSPTSSAKKGGGAKKSQVKKKDDEIERYHKVTKEIESIEKQKSEISSKKDNAFGLDKFPFIQKEIEALDKLISKHAEYKAEVEKNLKADWAAIQAYGFVDANGDNIIDNWEEIMIRELDAFNKVAKSGNDAAIEKATERYEEFKKLVEQYEDTAAKMEDAIIQEEEDRREKIALQLEKITTEVDFEVEIKQRDLDKLDYVIDKLGRNVNQMVEAIDKMGTKVGLYENQSEFYRNGIEQIYQNATGRELTDDEQRQIWEYEDALMDLNNSLMDLVETVENSLLEEFERLSSEIDDNINRFDTYSSAVDHYTSIIKLSGRQTKDSMLLMELSAQKTDIAMKKLNSTNDKYLAQQKTQADVKSNLEEALKSGNQADIDYWKKQYDEITKMVEESHNEMLGSWEEVLQAASDQFDQAIELTIQKLKDAISEYGLDGLADRYEKAKTVNEQYLSQLDKEYELNKLIRQMEKSVDETDNIKAKQILNDLLDQANEKMAENVQLSQYDLEYMQKQYDLELARIALEEAQNAKSVVRLNRDNEGNFGYIYTADQDQIDDAQQNYEDKLAETRQLSEEYIQEMSDLIIQNEQDLIDALASIDKTRFETKEEYEAEVERIAKYYLDRDIYLRTELDKAVQNSGKVYSDTILGQLENASKWDEAHNNLKTNTNEATDEMIEKWDEWKTNTENAMSEVGSSSESFTEDIKNDMSDIGDATEDLADEINTQTSNMITYMGNLVDAIENWRKKYIDAVDSIIRKNKELALSEGRDTKGEVPTETPPAAEIKPDGEIPPSADNDGFSTIGSKKFISEPAHYDASGATDNKYPPQPTNGNMYLVDINEGSRYPYGVAWKKNGARYGWVSSFDTGGYTGDWGPQGKLAMLHEKELVLNKDDTSNLLQTVDFIHKIISMIDSQAHTSSLFNMSAVAGITTGNEMLEQTVTIHAEFPNATDHNEIEEAFNNLINTASQYANRK